VNLARIYLARAYPDLSCGPTLDQAEADGLLDAAAELLRVLHSQGRGIAAPGTSVVAAARELERHHLTGLCNWRDELAQKVGNESLSQVEIVLTHLASPQAVTAYEQDHSYAVGMDFRLTTFLAALSAWAYFTARLEFDGMNPIDARSEFLAVLSDQVQLCYLNRGLPESFERRELGLLHSLSALDRALVDYVCSQATKFVLYHELAHIHLNHFSKGAAERLSDADTGRISAFGDQELEFEADRFANQHLVGPTEGVCPALTAKVAASIYFYSLALKEAMAPSPVAASGALVRVHPPSPERAVRLRSDFKPPIYLRQLEILLRVPDLLLGILESAAFQAAARFFRARSSG